MIEKKNGYMQLPPLPEELDGSLVHVLWEYAKLPEAERTATYMQYWKIANASREKVTEDTEVYHVDPENIAGFLESIRRVVTGIFHEAIGLAQYVYEECFVKGNALEDIMSDDPRMQEAITAVYKLYMDDKKAAKSDEVTS
nr:hypothetical protein [uncultured Blautia sp.]